MIKVKWKSALGVCLLHLLFLNGLILALYLFTFKTEIASHTYFSSFRLSALLILGIPFVIQVAKIGNYFFGMCFLNLLLLNGLILALYLFTFKTEIASHTYFSSFRISALLILGIPFVIQVAKIRNYFLSTHQQKNENKEPTTSLVITEANQEQQIHQYQLLIEREIWRLENIRGWLSYELHENIAQILVAAKNYLYSDAHSHSSAHPLNEKVGQIIEEAINNVRKLYERLEVPPLKLLGLMKCLQKKINQINQNGFTKITLKNNYEGVETLEESGMLIVYRVVSEKINNIVTHAKAREAKIEIDQQIDSIRIIVTDDGIGFYNSTRYWKNGLHMINTMVSSLGGTFTIKSAPGRGCQCIALIPIKKIH